MKRGNLRKTSALSFDDEDEADQEPLSASGPAKAPRPAVQARQKAERKSLLSFEDDAEDGEAALPVVVRPERRKLRGAGIARPESRELRLEARPASTQVSSAGEYSADRLKELQSSMLRKPVASAQPAFVVAGSFKAGPPKPSVAQTLSGGVLASNADSDSGGDSDGGALPSADAIRRAKETRERLRSAHLAPDYVPLAAGMGGGTDLRARDRKLTEEGAAPSGSDAEADDEDRGRMVFGLGTRSDAPGQLGPQDLDEEEAAWAEEQITK
ncbi:hypothetical protein APUTEX25_000049, partial [Auxenochlorella protothecoides]